MSGRWSEGHASGESMDAIDVHALIGHKESDGFHLLCGKPFGKNREDVAIFALRCNPVGVFAFFYGIESHNDIEFGGFEEHFFHHLSRSVGGGANENAEREGGVNIGLSNVQNVYTVFGHNGHEGSGESWTIFASDANQNQFFLHEVGALEGCFLGNAFAFNACCSIGSRRGELGL